MKQYLIMSIICANLVHAMGSELSLPEMFAINKLSVIELAALVEKKSDIIQKVHKTNKVAKKMDEYIAAGLYVEYVAFMIWFRSKSNTQYKTEAEQLWLNAKKIRDKMLDLSYAHKHYNDAQYEIHRKIITLLFLQLRVHVVTKLEVLDFNRTCIKAYRRLMVVILLISIPRFIYSSFFSEYTTAESA